MEERIQKIEAELEQIKQRNLRVAADKAWEVSLFRKILIAVITYIVAAVVIYLIGVDNFLSSAFVPTIGYLLSTLTVPVIKKWWLTKNS
ncbi:MAG: hypothetical protein KBB55_02870 [Candidatus Buchananbacteria bacterium]|nr:hypothetical protein [Candidatus Buchananbacteria bacterium]